MIDNNGRPRRTLNGRTNRITRPRTLRYAHIIGWGMEVPSQVLTNTDLSAIVETDDEWIVSRTGIKERRIAEQRETTTSLATRAAQKALDVADVLPSEIDLIIVATATPEHMFPSTASLVQDMLGATNAGAFDLSAACTGFIYALDMAVEQNPDRDDPDRRRDRRGNAQPRGGLVRPGDVHPVGRWSRRGGRAGQRDARWHPEQRFALGWLRLGYARPCLPSCSRDTYLQDGVHEMHKIYMDGKGVFRFATRVIGESIRDALEPLALKPEDLTLVIPHQANQRIIDYVAKSLKIPDDRVYSNIARYGNTSAATIPIALADAMSEDRLQPGDLLALVGFRGRAGVGRDDHRMVRPRRVPAVRSPGAGVRVNMRWPACGVR